MLPWLVHSNEILCILTSQEGRRLDLRVQKNCQWGKNPNLLRKTGFMDHRVRKFFSDFQLWPIAVLQPCEMQGCIVSHLKVRIKVPRFNFIMGLLKKCILQPKWILEVGCCVKSYEWIWVSFCFESVAEFLHSSEWLNIDAQLPTWISCLH